MTKKSIFFLGLQAALLSATASAVDLLTPTEQNAFLTYQEVTDCADSVPTGVKLEVTGYDCLMNCHENCTGHDNADAQVSAHIKATSTIMTFDQDVACEPHNYHESGGCGFDGVTSICEVTITSFPQHTNALSMLEGGEGIQAQHEHSVTAEPLKVCLKGGSDGEVDGDTRGVGSCHTDCGGGCC